MRIYALSDLKMAQMAEFAAVAFHESEPALWEELARGEPTEDERRSLAELTKRLLFYKTHRVNEATIWARAIYPLLALAEHGSIRAWAQVPLSARFTDIEIRGEVDGVLAPSHEEDVALPYLVVVEAKRGIDGQDPLAQLLGAMLCAAKMNQDAGHDQHEVFGCYTIADVWTFLRCQIDRWDEGRLSIKITASREYMEKTEAATILNLLKAILRKQF